MRFLLIALLIYSYGAYAQQTMLEYDIVNKGDIIGAMKLNLARTGTNYSIKMDSKVEVKFIVTTTIKMQEESHFQKDRLIHSTAKRMYNQTVKQNNQTKAADSFYYLINKGKTTTLKVPTINYNLLLLYYKEPVNISEVYSDSFQRFLKIDKVANHHYKITLPDGDHNEYFFENGVCSKVIIHGTFFQVQMLLKS